MEHGVLRVSETAIGSLQASRALVMLGAQSETLVFGNAAVSASQALKAAIDSVSRATDCQACADARANTNECDRVDSASCDERSVIRDEVTIVCDCANALPAGV